MPGLGCLECPPGGTGGSSRLLTVTARLQAVRGHSLSRRGIPSEPKHRGSGLSSFQRQGLRLGFLELFVQPCAFLSNLKIGAPPKAYYYYSFQSF